MLSRLGAVLDRAAEMLRTLKGAKRAFAAFVFGVVSAAAFPPLWLSIALLLGYAGLLLLLDGVKRGDIGTMARTGWAFGFGQFLVGLHWIGYSFLVDADAHGWQMPIAVVLLTAGLALFFALAGALYGLALRCGLGRGARRIFLLAAILAA